VDFHGRQGEAQELPDRALVNKIINTAKRLLTTTYSVEVVPKIESTKLATVSRNRFEKTAKGYVSFWFRTAILGDA